VFQLFSDKAGESPLCSGLFAYYDAALLMGGERERERESVCSVVWSLT
jgi:hypothetical protein